MFLFYLKNTALKFAVNVLIAFWFVCEEQIYGKFTTFHTFQARKNSTTF